MLRVPFSILLLLISTLFSSPVFAGWEATLASRYTHGAFDDRTRPIFSRFEPSTGQMYVLTADGVDVLSWSDQGVVSLVGQLPLSGNPEAMDLDAANGVIAITFVADTPTDNGQLRFFETRENAIPVSVGTTITVGPSPEGLCFSPDGSTLAVLNEGEATEDPLETYVDPEGSFSVIDMGNGAAAVTSDDVVSVGLTEYNEGGSKTLPEGVILREYPLQPPTATPSVAQRIEPGPRCVFENNQVFFSIAALNNAVIRVDTSSSEVTDIFPTGATDRSQDGNGFDASDSDGGIDIRTHEHVSSLRLPYSITFINERVYVGSKGRLGVINYVAEGRAQRAGTLPTTSLDPDSFPNRAQVLQSQNLGRLYIFNPWGQNDAGEYEELYAIGSRSVFAMNPTNGQVEYDSGDVIPSVVAQQEPSNFNTDRDEPTFDTESPSSGVSPSAVTSGRMNGRDYLFAALGNQGGFVVFDANDRDELVLELFENNRNFDQPEGPLAGDFDPYDIQWIDKDDNASGEYAVVLTNRGSATTTIYVLIETDDSPASAVQALTTLCLTVASLLMLFS